MTTYTLTGLSITYNQNDDPIAAGTATLQVVFPNDQAFLNYSLINTRGDDLPEVDLGGSEPQSSHINGANFSDSLFNEEFLGTFTTSQGTHVLLGFYQASTRTDFIFQIGGAPLTLPTTLAELQALENSITSFGVATGAFAPGQDIPFSSLQGVQISNAGALVNIINGDAGDNALEGTLANDDITTGGGFDFVFGSIGNDTIRMGDNGGTDGYVDLDYSSLDRGIAVVINGQNGTGSVNKADAGTDTLLGVSAPMNAGSLDGGFGLIGTGSNDTFDLNVGASQWMQVRGGLGVDSYVISGSGQVRLRFDGGIDDVSVNLATGQVLNDGFGNVETISGQVWELQSGDGNDRLIGSAADESFFAGGGNDTVDGGGGFDRIRYDRFGYENGVTVDLGAGTASGTWFGDVFNHTLTSIEWVRGSSGNDTIIGSSADERFEGRGGIDSFVYNGGNDTIRDFDFTSETLTVGLALTRTQVDAALTAASTTGQGVRVDFGSGNTLTFENASVANVQGLVGTAGGSEPGMVIPGTGGADVLNGGTGDDTINAGFGNDTVFGGAGNDEINAGFGFDLVYGGDGNDVVLGLNGFDTIYGDGGNDTLSGNAGNDVLYGGDGDDLLNGGIGFDELHGDAGNDSLIGLQGFDTLYGGDGADTLQGNDGNDVLYGGAGADRLEGGIGADTLHGDEGNDFLYGGNGGDLLFGGDGDDRLFGNAGNDTLDGGAGDDVLFGGLGADTFVFGVGYGQDRIADFQNNIDSIHIEADLLGGGTPVATDLIAFAGRTPEGFLILDFGNGDTLTLTGVTNTGAILDEVVFI